MTKPRYDDATPGAEIPDGFVPDIPHVQAPPSGAIATSDPGFATIEDGPVWVVASAYGMAGYLTIEVDPDADRQ